ncbi:MAG: SIMPL domain-containing protein [Piscinibacter sp.]|nr:SIMPL domain-containing protein [Piscinibacter sp.]
MKKSLLSSSLLLAALAGPALAQAETPAPQGVVGLAASATIEVTKDLLSVTLTTTREGTDATSVQTQLKQALDAALAEARKAARPGQLEVQTGNFSLYPRYASKGGISGWQGSAELLIEGRDMPAIGALTGRISTMTIARVGYGLSRELREKVEGEVAAQAIGRFKAKAGDYAKLFGYAGYVIREVSVNADSPVMYAAAPMVRAKAMSAAADESLPVEAGKGTVTVNVNGTVQMK